MPEEEDDRSGDGAAAARQRREVKDAREVDRAVAAIKSGDHADAERILREVVARVPAEYRDEYVAEGTLHKHFWSWEEFAYYGLREKADRDTVWLVTAYPRAYCMLGFVLLEQGEHEAALAALDAGLALEPGNASLRLEKAAVLRTIEAYEGALALGLEVMELGEVVLPRTRAMALRAVGGNLIRLGRLDDAEAAYRGSLELDPDSGLARYELRYIGHLRRGGESVSQATITTITQPPSECARCGAPMSEQRQGRLRSGVSGGLEFVCEPCHRKHTKQTKRWWEFWK